MSWTFWKKRGAKQATRTKKEELKEEARVQPQAQPQFRSLIDIDIDMYYEEQEGNLNIDEGNDSG